MTNLELLKQALDNIIEVNNFYKDSYDIKISTTNLEFIMYLLIRRNNLYDMLIIYCIIFIVKNHKNENRTIHNN